MQMLLMGTGTSHGVPCIACTCNVCRSPDMKDKRYRCSAFVTHKNENGTVSNILIDACPEFRIQALKYNIKKIDCILLTHSHADHIHGLDDVRIFSHTKSCGEKKSRLSKAVPGKGLKLYANKNTICDIRKRFSYVFTRTQTGGGKPKFNLINCSHLKKKFRLK